MVGRRGFFARAGAALVAAVAAPLFIPSERLEFGVPKLILPPEPALVPVTDIVIGGEVTLESLIVSTVCPADDTARLQAMLDRGGHIDLAGQTFYVSEPVRIRVDGTYLENAHVVYTRPVPSLVSIEGQNQTLVNSHFIGHPGGMGHDGVGIRVLSGVYEPHRPVRVEHGPGSGNVQRLPDVGWPSFSMRQEQAQVVPLAGETVHLSYLEEMQRLPDDWVTTLLRERG